MGGQSIWQIDFGKTLPWVHITVPNLTFTFLSLSVLIRKIGIKTAPPSHGVVRIQLDDAGKRARHLVSAQ